LAAAKPLVILSVGSGTESFDGIPQSQRTPLIAAFLNEHYTRETLPGTTVVLGRWADR
jgi:hypothetical protein